MRLAIVSVTNKGSLLSAVIKEKLSTEKKIDLFAKQGKNLLTVPVQEYDNLAELVQRSWQEYEGFIFIMATGIVVRVIAPHLIHKSIDPAIVCLDEQGNFVISLLSGHLGGANILAKQVAATMTHAQAVITTASDVHNMIAPDVLARELNLLVDDFSALKTMNSLLVEGNENGREILYLLDPDFPELIKHWQSLKNIRWQSLSTELIITPQISGVVIVSDKNAENLPQPEIPKLILIPMRNIVGIGCRRGISCAQLNIALQEACDLAKINPKSIKALTSAWVKQDEQGLLELAGEKNLPLTFYQATDIKNSIEKNKLTESNFVKQEIGVGNICEATALMQQGKLILGKTKLSGITMAIVRQA